MKLKRITAFLLLCTVFSLSACSSGSKEYYKTLSEQDFWDNSGEQAIAQYQIYHLMKDFFSDCKTQDGDMVDANGKVKKIAFIGLDGARADGLIPLFADGSESSGFKAVKQSGGLYLAYCGGEKGEKSKQSTSTSAGWTTALTGVWHTEHGVRDNEDVKKDVPDTIMLEYAKAGLQTSFTFDWGQYFDINLKKEVQYLLDNPKVTALYLDNDRAPAENKDVMEQTGDDLNRYNAVAYKGGDGKAFPSMLDYLKDRITQGDDFVGGVFQAPDSAGHNIGYGNDVPQYAEAMVDCDLAVAQLYSLIQERERNLNEDWLVIASSDHGGIKQGHGSQSAEERSIFIACNKAIDPKYFGAGYDGYKQQPTAADTSNSEKEPTT